MSILNTRPTPADRAQAYGMRLLTRAGGLDAVKNPTVRKRIEKLLYTSAKQGFKAQTVAGRAFTHIPGRDAPVRAASSRPRGVFDLNPTEDQQMIASVARELADEVLRPAAQAADADRSLPDKVRSQAAELGLTLIGVPAELGGIAEEASAVTGAIVLEQLARGDLGLTVALMSGAAVAGVIAAYGDADQQATYLPAFTHESDPATGALALQEPQPVFDPARPATLAIRRDDHLILNGTKALVPGAATGDLFVVSAMLDGSPRLVILPPGTPGLSHIDDPAMGLRAARTGRLVLQEVTVPAANLLGTTRDHLDAIRRARLAWAAAAVGTGTAALDQLTAYTTERKAFGEPIAHRQAVAFTIANIAIEVDALRLVVLRAAALLDAGGDASASIAHARSLTARHLTQVGSDAVQLLGGHGFVKEFDNERWYRDLRAAGVLEGTLYL